MAKPIDPRDNDQLDDLYAQASQGRTGIVREYIDYMLCTKKWWLLPIIVGLLLLAGFIVLSGTSMAPMIYALF